MKYVLLVVTALAIFGCSGRQDFLFDYGPCKCPKNVTTDANATTEDINLTVTY